MVCAGFRRPRRTGAPGGWARAVCGRRGSCSATCASPCKPPPPFSFICCHCTAVPYPLARAAALWLHIVAIPCTCASHVPCPFQHKPYSWLAISASPSDPPPSWILGRRLLLALSAPRSPLLQRWTSLRRVQATSKMSSPTRRCRGDLILCRALEGMPCS